LDSLISGGVSVRAAAAAPAAKPSSPKKQTSAKKAVKKPARKTPSSKPVTAKKAVSGGSEAPSSPPPAVPEQSNERGASVLGLKEIPIQRIKPNPHQPRRNFDETALRELAESIRSEGLLQPIVVRPSGNDYELIAGERRWRACQSLKLKQIPARIVEASETSSAVLSLIENLQREDLNPVEEALGYASLIREFGMTQEVVAERLGRARASIANSLRLLQLEKEIQGHLSRGLLSTGHAKVLLGVESSETRLFLARQILELGWSVRETERQVERTRAADRKPAAAGRGTPASELTAIRDLERQISSALSTPVALKHAPKKGKLIIEYHGNDDLQRLLGLMGIES
jgi:ParB family chromosome partitioning protein